jgi:hypothetical protein
MIITITSREPATEPAVDLPGTVSRGHGGRGLGNMPTRHAHANSTKLTDLLAAAVEDYWTRGAGYPQAILVAARHGLAASKEIYGPS